MIRFANRENKKKKNKKKIDRKRYARSVGRARFFFVTFVLCTQTKTVTVGDFTGFTQRRRGVETITIL